MVTTLPSGSMITNIGHCSTRNASPSFCFACETRVILRVKAQQSPRLYEATRPAHTCYQDQESEREREGRTSQLFWGMQSQGTSPEKSMSMISKFLPCPISFSYMYSSIC